MCLQFPIRPLVCLLIAFCAVVNCYADTPIERSERRVLRVCADPNNLPFTNKRLEGFENKLAELVARELDADLKYVWRAQRRGFFRKSLKENKADLVIGVPVGFEMALTTQPYYRSTYVFVSRCDRQLGLSTLDDPSLKQLKLGVQLVGDDGMNPPAAHSLARRGIIDNVVGYTVFGDYSEANPPARIVEGVVRGDIDAAVVWGPLAGYFAKHSKEPLDVVTVSPEVDPPVLKYSFSIAMGVKHGNDELQAEINNILTRNRAEIDNILREYGVPQLPLSGGSENGGEP